MDIITSFLRLLPILLLIFSSVYSEDLCIKKSPCRCEFLNGTWIDLTPSANSIYASMKTYVEKISGVVFNTFYFHPCYDVKMNMSVMTNLSNTCTDPLALCMHQTLWAKTVPDTLNKTSESYIFLGNSQNSDFASDGRYITYFNLPSTTIVYLICADTDDQLDIKDISSPNELKLQFFSRNACLRQRFYGTPGLFGTSLYGQRLSLVWPQTARIVSQPTATWQPTGDPFHRDMRKYNIF